MSDNYVIECKNLSCRMGKHYLIKDINWKVAPGEHWVVYGMNGSGKTTLLSIIAGFKHYTSGTLKLFGEEYTNENALAMRKKIGFVSGSFFDVHYHKENVLDIVLSGLTGTLSLDNDLTVEDAAYAYELLRALHLEEKMNRQFDMLSKGERQNVMIARALIHRPKILILDEPCSGLDVYNREFLLHTLSALGQDMTIIYITHYVEEIRPMFDKTLLLRKGHIFAQGNTEEMFTTQKLTELLQYPVMVEKNANHIMTLSMDIQNDLTPLLKGGETL